MKCIAKNSVNCSRWWMVELYQNLISDDEFSEFSVNIEKKGKFLLTAYVSSQFFA